ncbi:NmrA family NAD(P)-binding protein [Piscirickettsia litoralis]|uniref:NmrA-like domain-containing protein n=1 Tax=Piscirickettsia litoralis TaxID=1891921 RepID=A0ABX3A9R8_9GAMM|nr:NmrA family NAD(P)-binding protein [Piscirickettsia litoralis]ODN42869.1 hypothetical protein BGC07_07955 [Piscirickettsia litoralis]
MAKKRFLILGASGRTGFEVLRQAAAQADLYTVAAIHSPAKKSIVEPYANEVICLDYDQPGALLPALENIDVCYMVLPRHDHEITHANAIIEAAVQASIGHIIYLSALTLAGDTGAAAQTKIQIQHQIEQSGLNYTFLRPTFFMQRVLYLPFEKDRNRVRIFATVGEGRVPFIDTGDIAKAAIISINNPKLHRQGINLTGDYALSMAEVTRLLSRYLNKNVIYIDEPEENFSKRLIAEGYSDLRVEKQLETFRLWRANQHSDVCTDFYEATGQKKTDFKGFVERELSQIRRIYG